MYLKKRDYADEYQISVSTVDSRIRKIRRLIGTRYPRDAIVHTGRLIRIRDDVFADIMQWDDAIDCGIAPPFVPRETHAWELKFRRTRNEKAV